jgi:thymidylate synthase ThyX
MIEARIIADSITMYGKRLTTFVLTYPRFIHSEIMTHRAFSRNAASSRAIPFDKMVRTIRENIAMPVHWGSHQKGMQSGVEVEDTDRARMLWRRACESAILHAQDLDELGVHKSITNRLLEPFAHMVTIVSATEWGNFFHLRAHKDAMPEFQKLAFLMLEGYLSNVPRKMGTTSWHLPLVNPDELDGFDRLGGFTDRYFIARKVSVARCARVSYLNFKESTPGEDVALHDRLRDSGHWSPFEHVARPAMDATMRSGNFVGWQQYRQLFDTQNREDVDLTAILEARNDTSV